MGDESQADYDKYAAEQPKAKVIWLHHCRICKGEGTRLEMFVDAPPKTYPCGCVTHFHCPQCGHKHGKPFFAGTGDILRVCYVCHWRLE